MKLLTERGKVGFASLSIFPVATILCTTARGGTGLTWNPGYNQATNRYTLGGTSYDGAGNLLTDTFHTYTWNQDGLVSGVVDASTTLVYDALGRLVEKNTNGVYRQMVYMTCPALGWPTWSWDAVQIAVKRQ